MSLHQKRLRARSRSRRQDKASRRSGSVLVLALWAVSMLSAFTVIIGYAVRQKVAVAYRIDERQKLGLLCDAAVKQAAAVLIKTPEKSSAALNDPWSVNPEKFKDMKFPEGTVSVVYDAVDPQNGNAVSWYGMLDEGRKININTAELSALKRFFTIALGSDEIEAQDLAASIIDWRDADSEPSLPAGSAETVYYHGLPHPYEAKNAPFDRVEEVLLVKGMTPEIFAGTRDMMTVYGDGKININTAPETVLRAIGIAQDIAEVILLIRRGHDGTDGTSDDGVFEDSSGIIPKVSQHYSMTPEELTRLSQIVADSIAVSSEFYTARCTARLLNKRAVSHASCVMDSTGKTVMWGEL